MNSAMTDEIEAATTDAERLERIDNAIVAAAQEVQKEARESRELAARERERADAAERETQERLREAEAARRDQEERARMRQEAAVRVEAERAERARADERRQHAEELRKRDEVLAVRTTERNTARRRLLLGSAFVVSLIAFLLLDLAFGLDTARAVVGAVALLLGLWLGVDQLVRRRVEDD